MPFVAPTAEARHIRNVAARDRYFIPRPAPAPERATDSIEAAEARTRALWVSDRAARIRNGACPVCAERRCPRVGGRDVACVVDG